MEEAAIWYIFLLFLILILLFSNICCNNTRFVHIKLKYIFMHLCLVVNIKQFCCYMLLLLYVHKI